MLGKLTEVFLKKKTGQQKVPFSAVI